MYIMRAIKRCMENDARNDSVKTMIKTSKQKSELTLLGIEDRMKALHKITVNTNLRVLSM